MENGTLRTNDAFGGCAGSVATGDVDASELAADARVYDV